MNDLVLPTFPTRADVTVSQHTIDWDYSVKYSIPSNDVQPALTDQVYPV